MTVNELIKELKAAKRQGYGEKELMDEGYCEITGIAHYEEGDKIVICSKVPPWMG